MRFGFPRQRPVTPARPAGPPQASVMAADFDIRIIGRALRRGKKWILVPSALALMLSLAAVNIITPRYKSEARIITEGRENIFLRPNAERTEDRAALDPEAVTSQVQLVLSRDLARDIIRKNKLAERAEFDPLIKGVSPLKTVLALFGIGRDPFRLTPEERVLDAYYERLAAYAVDKSRVIAIEFQSGDPELAASVANAIAEGYLVLQQAAKQNQARAAGQWLSGEIDTLRKKVAEAESRVEDFRSRSSLFVGTNNTTLSNQQLGEINTQLNAARAQKSDAESRARLIREMLQSGRPIESAEVINSELVRRLTEQRVTLRAQLAEQSSTLLDGHPRIKELKAQIADLDRQLRDEAAKIVRALENDARIAAARVDSLSASLDQLKKTATSSNSQDVQLRALDREAKAQRDLLESYLAKYREATTRETIDSAPADARIISRAIVTNSPAFPKKLPIVLIVTLITLLITAGTITTGELLRMTAPQAYQRVPDTHPALAASIGDIEKVAAELRAAGEGARVVMMIGAARRVGTTMTALTLARLLAREARVVLVDLAFSSPAIAASSSDPAAPGLAELVRGEAGFGDIVTHDSLSGLHLVAAGAAADGAVLGSPRLAMTLDALTEVYDHVVIDAGALAELPVARLGGHVRAVLVTDPSWPEAVRAAACAELVKAGFETVAVLTSASGAAGEASARMAAA
ncbi:MAG: lipopolysaccharide biosynthesis protein [Xanthobacteraceae bacterium]|nr:MAG: lipopolysaccharide biosynthesis protein [Xanthobacteraceae bacterium]